jgi:two-component system, NarL family, sensor histidine kinase UhpB
VSLFWRVFILNALVFTLGTAALLFSPVTVSAPILFTEALVLIAGLTVIVVVNAVLLHVALAPLQRLTRLMKTIDLLQPGQRLPIAGDAEVAELVQTFNEMIDRLEGERRASSTRALRAQEAERQRIAQELHDQIGQNLTVVLLNLKRAADRVPADVRSALLEAQEVTRDSLDEVRGIARSLRPGVLEDLGLISALTALAADFSRHTGLPVQRHFDASLPSLAAETELVLYRIAQESLTNIARHAHACHVEMTMHRSPSGIVLRIADDGRGLDGTGEGWGIRGMRERAMLIGADLAITARPGAGTEVCLQVPLDETGS